MVVCVNGTKGKRERIRRFFADESGQGLVEYALMTAVMVALAAYLYYPDNFIVQGMRHTYNKTAIVVAWPGP